MACVWPDQRDRFERLASAIEVAAAHPSEIIRGDATATVALAVEQVGAAAHPTVINSWVLNYLTPSERAAYVAELDRIGAERDVSWLFLESPGLAAGLPFPAELEHSFLTHLVLATWRDGRRSITHLGECHPHGYWLHWVSGSGHGSARECRPLC